MSELVAISALIGDRSYRIKINPEDEQVVRHTIKLINNKITEFKTQFAGKDIQDYIAMVLVWYATEQHAEAATDLKNESLANGLNRIEKLLDASLKDEPIS